MALNTSQDFKDAADVGQYGWVSQEAYGRVKLCNTMVADHFIPAYLASLGSVIESLEQEQ